MFKRGETVFYKGHKLEYIAPAFTEGMILVRSKDRIPDPYFHFHYITSTASGHSYRIRKELVVREVFCNQDALSFLRRD